MDNSKKKPVMIGAIVACLVVAVVVTYMNSGTSSDIGSMKRGQLTWVKCNNPDCKAEYQMDKKDYFEYLQENATGMSTPALVCKECGEESVYQAVKCEKCGLIFTSGSVPNDFSDRCPECKYSKIEDSRKQDIEEN